MSENQQHGFYSLSYVDPADEILVRPTSRSIVMTSMELQIAKAVQFLEEQGYTVIPPKEANP